jgi:hypothetical protein
MRVDLAQFAITLIYLLPGMAFLLCVRVIAPTPRQLFASIGLAYLTGTALVTLGAIAVLLAGFAMSAWRYALLALLLTTALAVPGIRRDRASGRKRPVRAKFERERAVDWIKSRSGAWWIAVFSLCVVGALAALGYVAALNRPVVGWDGWAMWLRKALMIYDHGSLPTEFFTSPAYEFMHADYPIFIPVWGSAFFHMAGEDAALALHGQFWIMHVMGLWAAAFLAHRVAPAVMRSKDWAAVLWVAMIGMLLLSPTLHGQLMGLYADVPLGLFALAATLALAAALKTENRSYFWTAVLLLCAVANIKNEGLMTAAAVLASYTAVVVVAPGPRSRLNALTASVAGGLIVLLSTVPWRAWFSSHGIESDMPLSRGLSPGYILDRLDRVSPTIHSLGSKLNEPGLWNLMPAIAFTLIVVCLILGVRRRVASFYLLTIIGVGLLLVWAYVVSQSELHWLLQNSADRTTVGLGMISASAMLHLSLALAAFAARPRSSESGPAEAPSAGDGPG